MKKDLLLIHGLNQKKLSFWKFLGEFKNEYNVRYFHYSNTSTLSEIIEQLRDFIKSLESFHAITMSLGGIILRNYLAQHGTGGLGRVVMVGPPNAGAILLRNAVKDPMWRKFLGKLAVDVVEHEREYLPLKPEFEVGIIAGTKPVLLSPPVPKSYLEKFFDPTDSDGKVKIEETKLPFMKDFVTVDECHDLLMQNTEVLNYIKCFLCGGTFTSTKLEFSEKE